MPGMDELMARDAERMGVIETVVKVAMDTIENCANNRLEYEYMTYKVGGRLMMSVLEGIDKQVLAQDLLAIGGGKMPVYPTHEPEGMLDGIPLTPPVAKI